MKRIALTIFFLFFAVNTWAAMTCVELGYPDTEYEQASHYMITLECTFDTTPGTAVAAIPAATMAKMQRGRYIYTFATIPGSTGPTDDSDLQIHDSSSKVILSASGNGANVIDNTAINSVIYGDGTTPGSTNHYPKPHQVRVWTITVTNNAVNSSSFKLEMETGP